MIERRNSFDARQAAESFRSRLPNFGRCGLGPEQGVDAGNSDLIGRLLAWQYIEGVGAAESANALMLEAARALSARVQNPLSIPVQGYPVVPNIQSQEVLA